jgi:spoIIIJ-associated protein
MQTIEVTGKSLEEAKSKAAEQLGVPADALTVTVLEQSKGLFGKSNVRIRAEASDVGSAEPQEAKAEKPAKEKPKAAKAAEKAEEPEAEAAPEPKKRGRSRSAKAEAEPEAEPAQETEKAPAEDAPAADIQATQEDADNLVELVREIVRVGELDVDVREANANGRYVNIELDGRDVAHLVGKHGEVLNALQYLVNVIAAQKYGNGIRATLDGNNYRRRREEALTTMATKIAEQVRKRGEEAVLDALPAFERRVVHKALASFDGVSTYSEGEEPDRRVVIAPAE